MLWLSYGYTLKKIGMCLENPLQYNQSSSHSRTVGNVAFQDLTPSLFFIAAPDFHIDEDRVVETTVSLIQFFDHLQHCYSKTFLEQIL